MFICTRLRQLWYMHHKCVCWIVIWPPCNNFMSLNRKTVFKRNLRFVGTRHGWSCSLSSLAPVSMVYRRTKCNHFSTHVHTSLILLRHCYEYLLYVLVLPKCFLSPSLSFSLPLPPSPSYTRPSTSHSNQFFSLLFLDSALLEPPSWWSLPDNHQQFHRALCRDSSGALPRNWELQSLLICRRFQ